MSYNKVAYEKKKDKPWFKACRRRYHLKYQQTDKYKASQRSGRLTPASRFNNYKCNAKARGHEFLLTKEEFMLHWKKDCRYCGAEIKTIGLDRVDSSIGYRFDNIIPCCKLCNYMKRDLTKDQFISQCKKILERAW